MCALVPVLVRVVAMAQGAVAAVAADAGSDRRTGRAGELDQILDGLPPLGVLARNAGRLLPRRRPDGGNPTQGDWKGKGRCKLQALIYDILPSTTAVFIVTP